MGEKESERLVSRVGCQLTASLNSHQGEKTEKI